MRALAPIFAAFGITIISITTQSASSANDPMDGTWDLDVAASRFNPGPARNSDTRIYKVEGNSIRMAATSVFADGRSENIQFDAVLDGRDYPAAGNPRVETIAQTRVDAYTIKTATKREGKVAATSTCQVSNDGTTMTIHTAGTDENGCSAPTAVLAPARPAPQPRR